MRKNCLNSKALITKIATNLVLSVLIFSIGALCLSSTEKDITADVEQPGVYRFAENGKGVSLMFNVYWGTEEVYNILKILEKHEAKATFFIGGCWADDNVECLKAIHEAGHEIGNHGYFHKDHAKLDLVSNQREISQCNQFIELAIGEKVTLFAPPSGAYGNTMLSACKALGMRTILWSKDTIDWRDKDSALIYKRATSDVKKGDFILMHPMQATVEALEDVLVHYETLYLEAVTVSENLQENG